MNKKMLLLAATALSLGSLVFIACAPAPVPAAPGPGGPTPAIGEPATPPPAIGEPVAPPPESGETPSPAPDAGEPGTTPPENSAPVPPHEPTGPSETGDITATPAPRNFGGPITIIDDMDPELCNLVHNINACFSDGKPFDNTAFGEYFDLFMAARADLVNRQGVHIDQIKMYSLQRVEWSDTSLGVPQGDMMYAQVITPGFVLVLEAQGELFTYHTSIDRVVYAPRPGEVVTGDGGSNDAHDGPVNEETLAAVIEAVLQWAIVEGNIPDSQFIGEDGTYYVSTENIAAELLPDFEGLTLTAMTPGEIQSRANTEGDYLYLRFNVIDIAGENAKVSINNTWAVGESSTTGYLSGGGCTLTLRTVNGAWIIDSDAVMRCWIA